MRLFSYIVARDYGFAPNPFFGVCTLATCKPRIRGAASVGDWIIGTGSSRNSQQGHLVYAMRVTEAMTFSEYWAGERMQCKRPNLRGSKKQAFGDNIYSKDDAGQWLQRDSHHSYRGGVPNVANIQRDTGTDRVLLGDDFAYWGGSGPKIPTRFRDYHGVDICCVTQGHKCRFPNVLISEFVAWFRSLHVNGYLGRPLDWSSS